MIIRFKSRALAAAVLAASACFLVSGVGAVEVHAQDASALVGRLQQGADLLQRGRTSEANAVFRSILADDPSSEDAYNLVRDTDHQVFLEMLKAGGESSLAARRLLDLSHREGSARSQDQGAISSLVSGAVQGRDHLSRMAAVRKLAGSHGEYAVPSLVGYLGSNSIDARANAIIALTHIGSDAVVPLAASLGTGNEMQVKNTLGVLKRIGDHRSAPAVMAHKNDGGASAAFVELAHSYFDGDPDVLRNWDGTFSVWTLDNGRLASRDTPRFLYNYEMAQHAAYDALAADPDFAPARATISLASSAKIAAWNGIGAEAQADESMAGAAKSVAAAHALAGAAGTNDILMAYGMAMKLGHAEAGQMLADTIVTRGSGGKLMGDNPLVAGLTHDDKAFRYTSAIALLRLDPGARFPGSDKVAVVAGEAASEVAVQQVLVIDSDSKNAMNAQRALNDAGYHAVAATSGASGLILAKATGAFDAVLVNSSLDDMTTFQVIDDLARDFRTQNAKVVVMADGGLMNRADYDKRGVAGVSPSSTDKVGLVNSIGEALGDASDAQAASANALSIAASNAMAWSSGAAFDLSDAETGLVAALRDNAPDDVRLAALGALANLATPKASGVLSSVLSTSDNAAGVRAAAAAALGHAISGEEPDGGAFNSLLNAMADEDGGVAAAAGRALGTAKLTSEQRARVYTASRGW